MTLSTIFVLQTDYLFLPHVSLLYA